MKNKAQVQYEGDTEYVPPPQLCFIAEHIAEKYWRLDEPAPERFCLDINLVDDETITEINTRYLGHQRPTDVIAFALMEGEPCPDTDMPLIGQIVISKDAVIRQAGIYGHSEKAEFTTLAIHGMLHLAGWDEGPEIQKCQEMIKKIL